MTSKIIAIQGNNLSTLKPNTDTTIFLANEVQNKGYKVFYYNPKELTILKSKVFAKGVFIRLNYKKKNFL